MAEIYDFDESTGLAEALQKKAEQEAKMSGCSSEGAKKSGVRKYNEVKRSHAIEFIKKLDKRLDGLSNQSIADLLRALIALGLSIEDEEELEYWINLLATEAINRMILCFNQQGLSGRYGSEEIAALLDVVNSLKEINSVWNTNNEKWQKRNRNLDKVKNLLQKRLNKGQKSRKTKNRRQRNNQDPLEILKNKMTAEGVEIGSRYWTSVVTDFELAADKNDFAYNWRIDNNKKNELDIQQINELRGISENTLHKKDEQKYEKQLQKQKEKETKIKESEQKQLTKNINTEKINAAFQKPENRRAAEKYAAKKEKKTGRQLDKKDIKIMKMKANGNNGR